MKTYRLFSLLALAGALAASEARATLSYLVDINTASLVGNPSGPFSLDIQLNNGVGGLPNTATLSGFTFTGGSAVAGTTFSNGNVSGNFQGTLSLNDNLQQFNEFYQQFAAGTTDIQFNLTLTTNAKGATPDGFSIAILDGSTFNIPTNDPSLGDTLLLANIDGHGVSYTTSQSIGATGGVTLSIAAIPEPATTAALLGSLAMLLVAARRFQKKHVS